MTACIFLGPTLAVADAQATLAARYLPPVRQGDVHRTVLRFRPRIIGIVDGYFHQVPSVWHKEILWAMAEGVHVVGSASMGALRAAELHPFGMQGVGHVFAAFRDRILEDDDEVAVIHAPEQIGFVAASEAMVNIRWTLDAAGAEAVVGSVTQQKLKDIAKSLFYPYRSYPEILKRGGAEGLPEDELAALSAWLEQSRIDVKREDALEMLRCMKDMLEDDPPAKRVAYTFEHTTMWQAAVSANGIRDDGGGSVLDQPIDDWLMDEIRLDEAVHEQLKQAALLRLLALREAERLKFCVQEDEHRQAANNFRLERDLHRGADLKAWLAERDLDRNSFDRLLDDTLLIDKVADDLREWIARFAIEELRVGGDYPGLIARARAKRQLALAAERDRDLIGDLRAITWYFEHRVGAQLPDDLDVYARRRGFGGAADFRRAVMGEFLYEHRNEKAPQS